VVARKHKTWTLELIIGQILRHEANHTSLRSRVIKKIDYRLYSAAIRKFGSWSQALSCAGIPLYKYCKTRNDRMKNLLYWTPKKITEAILQRAIKRQSLQSTNIQPLALRMAALKRYGSWAAAVRAAGLNPAEHRCHNEWKPKRWNRDIIKSEILNRAKCGLGLLPREVRTQDRHLFIAAKRYFGSWPEALAFAGVDNITYTY
jgi:hypothetical protein